MNYIDINESHIIDARDKHYKYLRYVIKKKLNGTSFNETKPHPNLKLVQKVSGIHSGVKSFLNKEENLKKVLIGTPDGLDAIKGLFTTKKQINSIKKLFNYDTWIDYSNESTYSFYNAYDLANNLDIPTCPYCNRMYTKTVITRGGEKITRPTFDHWFPKSLYPLLSLSFYNLIPSCSVCNSGLKGADDFSLNTHFHPYHKSTKASEVINFKFSYDYKNYSTFKFKIIPKNTFSKESTEAFKLEEIYKTHEDEISDLRRLKDIYSDSYLEMLKKNILKGTHVSEKEIYRLAFGTYLDENQFDRRPLSKMKKDILEELGILKKI